MTLNIDYRQHGGFPVSQGGATSWNFGWAGGVAQAEVGLQLRRIEAWQGCPATLAGSDLMSRADDGKARMLWKAEEALTGTPRRAWGQKSVGSCVSFGWGHFLNDLLSYMAVSGKILPLKTEVATEPIYWGSRVEVGRNVLGSGDGSTGGWAARWCGLWGVLMRGVYGSIDLREYTTTMCRMYATRGVPDELEALAKLHPVQQVVQVANGAEGWRVIGAGYCIPVCSNLGFDSPLKKGFCRRNGVWNHCMEIIGRLLSPSGDKIGVWCNSWEDYLRAQGNPERIVATSEGPVEVPLGCFCTPWSDVDDALRQQDSYTGSDVFGFPERDPFYY